VGNEVDIDGFLPSEMRLLYPFASNTTVWSKGDNLSISLPYLRIEISSVPQGTTLNEVVKSELKQVNASIHSGDFAIGSGELLDSAPLTHVNGNEAYKVVYTCYCSPDLSLMKFMEIWTVKDEIFYELSWSNFYSGFDADIPEVQKIIDSFELKS